MEIKNFAILKGESLTIKDGKLIYKPSDKKKHQKLAQVKIDEKKNASVDIVSIKSDVTFGNGSLEFFLKAKSVNTGVMLTLKAFDNRKVRCGYSGDWAQFLIIIEEGTGWKILSDSGSLSNYDLHEELHFRIDIHGSSLSILVNKIILCETNISIKESPIEFTLGSDSEFEVSNIKLNRSAPKIFIVMQFSKEYNELYEEVIKPVSEKFGYQCVRADEFYTGTPIISDIISSIQEATAIIAEITPDNPNVFYEIGYAHAIKKPTILLCDTRREKLPFDLSSFRTLFYENTIAGKKKVESSLTKYLENIK